MCHIEAKKVKNLQVEINAAVECFVCELYVIDYISSLMRTYTSYIRARVRIKREINIFI